MIIRWGGALLAAVLGWIAIMAVVMRFSDAAPAAVVFFPPEGFVASLPEDTTILSYTRYTLTLQSEQTTGFGAILYRSGAWLVLPAGLIGCLPLSGPR
ncbi:MAG: hypothetical protein LJE68_11440 [Rhodobacter sp.]|nr:hypothetical protein [Rhodobacter sp.]